MIMPWLVFLGHTMCHLKLTLLQTLPLKMDDVIAMDKGVITYYNGTDDKKRLDEGL